jgi:hypothetical protein
MTEKHNQYPTARKKSSGYRKTIELNSASQWDSFNLGLFHVDFLPEQLTELTEVVADHFYQINPENEIDRRT